MSYVKHGVCRDRETANVVEESEQEFDDFRAAFTNAIEEMQSALGYGCNVEIDMAQASREFIQYTIYSTNVYTIYTVASKASIAFLERAALEAYAAMDEAFRRAR